MSVPLAGLISPRLLISRVSVRTRIIALAIVPLIGFLANGVAFTSGKTEVDAAMDALKARMAEAGTSAPAAPAKEKAKISSAFEE